jgi:acyl-coenzyme A synthetase/AMP-(fatty) acid ligase
MCSSASPTAGPTRLRSRAGRAAFSAPEHESLTYRQADDVANRVANLLMSHGVSRGDRCLLICENSVEAYVAKIGAAKLGVVTAPLNPALAADVVALRRAGASVDVTITIGGDVVKGSESFASAVGAAPATDPEGTVHGDDIWEILFGHYASDNP